MCRQHARRVRREASVEARVAELAGKVGYEALTNPTTAALLRLVAEREYRMTPPPPPPTPKRRPASDAGRRRAVPAARAALAAPAPPPPPPARTIHVQRFIYPEE